MATGRHTVRKQSSFKRVTRWVVAVLVAIAATILIACWGRMFSVLSVHRVATGLYAMDYAANYHLDEYLAEGVLDKESLDSFVSKHLLFGQELDVESRYKKSAGTAFFTWNDSGEYFIAHNYEAPAGNSLVVTTHPKGRYASISTVDLSLLGLEDDTNAPDAPFSNRVACLYAPYLPVDGCNDQGLSVAALAVSAGKLNQKTGHTPLSVTGAVRLCLDEAATVNEAIDLLKNFDLRTKKKVSYQFLIADASGAHAIVAYDSDNNLYTVDDTLVSGFVLSTEAGSSRAESNTQFGNVTSTVTGSTDENKDDAMKPGSGSGHEAYNAEQSKLNTYGWIISEDEAFEVLEAGKTTTEGWITNWSVVYNMTARNMQICVHEGFANRHSFSL